MTITEARHILNNGIKPSANLICMAQGFLEGHKAALESAARHIEKKCPFPFPIICGDKYGFHALAKEIRGLNSGPQEAQK